jgi:hypothetical protein
MQADITTLPVPERYDDAYSLVAVISVCTCGDADVDDNTREWESGRVGVQRKNLAVEAELIVFVWQLVTQLYINLITMTCFTLIDRRYSR